jgi:hypothetical protein
MPKLPPGKLYSIFLNFILTPADYLRNTRTSSSEITPVFFMELANRTV